MRKLKLAIVGCGAVAEFFHLPASKLTDKVEIAVLVDRVLPRAQELATRYNVPSVADDYQAIAGKVDAALVALPNNLHAPVTIDLLRRGVHVLVEKPMAFSIAECDEMITSAREANMTLAVGLVRRFYDSSQGVKGIIESGILGRITSFDLREGGVYRWAVATDAPFRRDISGGGALADTGAHTLDLLLWWLGDYETVDYYDDAMGGVEADCEIHLRMRGGVTGIVELSRTRKLRNTFIIRGERGALEIENEYDPQVSLTIKGQDFLLAGRVAPRVKEVERITHNGWPVFDAFRRQFDDFADAVLSRRPPFIPGEEGRGAVELIETCYRTKRLLQLPWMTTSAAMVAEEALT
ncbi:MAG: Gfo/Idh/MocA family oxidoreductase [Pyrinomonadaceae bacterium]